MGIFLLIAYLLLIISQRLSTIIGLKCMLVLCYLPARVGLYCRPWQIYQIVTADVELTDAV